MSNTAIAPLHVPSEFETRQHAVTGMGSLIPYALPEESDGAWIAGAAWAKLLANLQAGDTITGGIWFRSADGVEGTREVTVILDRTPWQTGRNLIACGQVTPAQGGGPVALVPSTMRLIAGGAR